MTGYVVLQALYAIAIVGLSWVLSGWIAGIVNAALDRSSVDPTIRVTLVRLVRPAVFVAGLIAAMGILGLDPAGFLVILAAIGLALGLGLRDTMARAVRGPRSVPTTVHARRSDSRRGAVGHGDAHRAPHHGDRDARRRGGHGSEHDAHEPPAPQPEPARRARASVRFALPADAKLGDLRDRMTRHSSPRRVSSPTAARQSR